MWKTFLYPLSLRHRAFTLEASGFLAIEVARQSLITRTHQSRNAIYSVVGACVAVGILYSFVMPIWRPLGWLLPLASLQFIHRHFSLRSIADIEHFTTLDIAAAERYHTLATILLAFAIGSGIWWVGVGTNHRELCYVTTIIQCIYAIGSTTNTATHTPTSMFTIWINLGLAALFWLLAGTSEIGAAASLIALSIYLSGYVHVVHRNFVELIRIRFENLDLISALEAQKDAAEAARSESEKANLSKSQFLAAASHDLRQPLHALMLFSSLLDDSSPEQRKILMTHIHSAAESLNHLFGGLLDLSRLDAGAIQPQLTNVNLQPLIESLAIEFSAKAHQKKLEFSAEYEELAAITDPFLLERILRNLLDNAVKYTNSGFIKFSVTELESTVRISITDSGAGISDEFHEHIFSEFFQLGNPARNSEHGTGLGLSIVKRLCDLMGHQRFLQSTPGKGSCFSVHLLSATLPEITAETTSGSINFGGLADLCVLVVDDDPRVRAAMEGLLRSWRCNAISAGSGAELNALTDNMQSLPDALIADYRLAGDDNGFELIASVRARWPELPAAIFTGDTAINWRNGGIPSDIPIFQKPVEPHQIASWLLASSREKKSTPA